MQYHCSSLEFVLIFTPHRGPQNEKYPKQANTFIVSTGFLPVYLHVEPSYIICSYFSTIFQFFYLSLFLFSYIIYLLVLNSSNDILYFIYNKVILIFIADVFNQFC